jgi:hypothetical protein
VSKNTFLQRLHSEPLFQEYIVKELEKSIPKIPPYDPTQDNTEIWKANSSELRGYKLACSILGVKL